MPWPDVPDTVRDRASKLCSKEVCVVHPRSSTSDRLVFAVDGARHAVMWDPDGTTHDLGAGPRSEAKDIADDGTIVGHRVWTDSGPDTGFVRVAATGVLSPLPLALPDSGSLAYQRPAASNRHGDIVGTELLHRWRRWPYRGAVAGTGPPACGSPG
jgi:hypothetical protein